MLRLDEKEAYNYSHTNQMTIMLFPFHDLKVLCPLPLFYNL